jgi:nanoRNase/pAp phosphatase (c-di-AMP/oligoRNAs hydrolase)
MTAETGSATEPGERLRALREAVEAVRGPLLIQGHNYPDPDCLAAALGMQALLAQAFERTSVIAFGGGLGRAENRAMAGILGIDYRDVDEIVPSEFAGVIVVDSQPSAGNLAVPEGLPVVAVLDHHEAPESDYEAAWRDIRTDLGATCSLLVEYLDHAGLHIDERLATALLIGIRTDTEDLERDGTDMDVAAYVRLFPDVDRSIMIQVLRPPLSEEYFGLLHTALETARSYDTIVVAPLGRLPAPDLLSEISELFLRLKGVHVSLAVGYYAGGVNLSLRSARPRKGLQGVLRDLVGATGRAGGHGRAMGGRVPADDGDAEAEIERICKGFVERVGSLESGPRPVAFTESLKVPESE